MARDRAEAVFNMLDINQDGEVEEEEFVEVNL